MQVMGVKMEEDVPLQCLRRFAGRVGSRILKRFSNWKIFRIEIQLFIFGASQ